MFNSYPCTLVVCQHQRVTYKLAICILPLSSFPPIISDSPVISPVSLFLWDKLQVLLTMYKLKVDVDMLNVVKSALTDASSVSPSPKSLLR